MPIGRAEPTKTLDDLLARSDFVVVMVTQCPENKELFGASQFAKMKKGSYFVNVSYADAVNESALASALKSGHLAGAAVDVINSYPGTNSSSSVSPLANSVNAAETTGVFTSPLSNIPNVIMTPSIGIYIKLTKAGSTIESYIRIVKEVCQSTVRFIQTGTTTGSVNFPSIVMPDKKAGQCRILCIHHNVRGVLRVIIV